MYNISSDEIIKMDKIGSGTFGSVYLKDNQVLKVYHEKIKTYNIVSGSYNAIPNPCLKYNKIKYQYLKNKTDLVSDILYIDGIFSGIVMPYYKGKTFKEYMNNPIEEKINMSNKLLLSSKKLTNNYIYPLDYKENNIIFSDNKVQIIDLDDKLTKILNPIYKSKSIKVLDGSIKRFIGDIDYNIYVNNKENIQNYITKKERKINTSYNEIEDYLNNIIIKNNYILLSDRSNISNYIELLRNPNYRVIYVYKSINDIEVKLLKLLKLNIKIYNIIPKNKLKEFISSISYEDLLSLSENNIVKIKKKDLVK